MLFHGGVSDHSKQVAQSNICINGDKEEFL